MEIKHTGDWKKKTENKKKTYRRPKQKHTEGQKENTENKKKTY